MLKMLDLFSGIGGFSLAASWTGEIETVAFCEIEPYPQKVLQKNFPGVPIYDDVRELTAERLRADGIDRVDIVTGGFPCQPFSVAGKQRGAEDDRFLWPEMLRVIAELKPTWVIGENVAGFVSMALDECVFDLENIGYEVQPIIIPACGVNAEHERERVWIIAHFDAERKLQPEGMRQIKRGWPGNRSEATLADTDQTRLSGGVQSDQNNGDVEKYEPGDRPTINHVCTVSREHWNYQPVLGRGVHGVSNRLDRIAALGNSIVPQVAYPILQAIVDIEVAK